MGTKIPPAIFLTGGIKYALLFLIDQFLLVWLYETSMVPLSTLFHVLSLPGLSDILFLYLPYQSTSNSMVFPFFDSTL